MSRRPVVPERQGPGHEAGQRLDKWLWFARMAKSRTLAQELVAGGKVRINREKQLSPSRLVRPGDVLTITLPAGPRVLRIVSGGERRGPAPESRLLYEDLAPSKEPEDEA